MAEEKNEIREKIKYAPLLFVMETDSLGRKIPVDQAQIRLRDKDRPTEFMVLQDAKGISLCIVRPDETDQTVSGNTWFVFGDFETGEISIAATKGQFNVPRQIITISSTSPEKIVSFIPDNNPDLSTRTKSLQPIGLIMLDKTLVIPQLVFCRKLTENYDRSSNTISFEAVRYELSHPQVLETKGIDKIIAEWETEKKEHVLISNNLKDIQIDVIAAARRLAHRKRHLPPELIPVYQYDEKSKIYSITLNISPHGRDQIIGKATADTSLDTQIGEDYGFGKRLSFICDESPPNDLTRPITGKFILSSYNEENQRVERILADNVKISVTGNKLTTNLYQDIIGEPVYAMEFSSVHPEDIMETLRGIDRGLKPRYPYPGELNVT